MPSTHLLSPVPSRTPGSGTSAPASGPEPLTEQATSAPARHAPLAPAWGWSIHDGGRAVHVAPGLEYQATTTQLCGLYPFVAGSGTPVVGTPVGRHQLWGEVACLDPLAWLRAGLVTNPGMFVLGQPGTGKSALVKRLVTGAVAFGTRILVLGDPKPDYTPLVALPRRTGHPHRPRPGQDQPAGCRAARRRPGEDDWPGRAAAAVGSTVTATDPADGAGYPHPRRADHQR